MQVQPTFGAHVLLPLNLAVSATGFSSFEGRRQEGCDFSPVSRW